MEIVFLQGDESSPEAVEVIVEEDDRDLLLRQQPLLFGVSEEYSALNESMQEDVRRAAGEVVVCEGHPLRLIAIVYDLDRVPIWDEAWIDHAYSRIFTELGRWQAATVMMPLLGVAHGKVLLSQTVGLFRHALEEHQPALLERIYISVSQGCGSNDVKRLFG